MVHIEKEKRANVEMKQSTSKMVMSLKGNIAVHGIGIFL